MKKMVLLLTSVLLVGSSSFAKVQTLDKVDLGKFAGTWYRISANPIIFEPKSACARQVLTPVPDSKVAVYNSGISEANGKLFEIRGTAEAIDQTGSKLAIDFGLPWKGTYWIIALDRQYRYAAVTDAHGYSLYIMSRTPALDAKLYQEAVDAASLHVNTKKLQMENQTNCHYPPVNF